MATNTNRRGVGVKRGVSAKQILAKFRESESKDVGELSRRMRDDYQVSLALKVLSANIKAAKVSVQVDGDANALATLLANHLQGLWDQSLSAMLGCIPDGRVAFEKVWSYNASVNLSFIRCLDALPFPMTEMRLGSAGEFDGIDLESGDEKEPIQIPASNAWWLAIDATALEPHGRSRFVGAPAEVWKERRAAIKLREVLRMKRIVSGGVARVPFGETTEDGQEVDNAGAIASAVDELNAGGTLILSSERDAEGNPLFEVSAPEVLDFGPLEASIDGMDQEQLQAFGIPPKTILEGDSTGSHAMVSQQMLTLYAVVEDILVQLENSFQKYVIDKEIDANYAPGTGPRIRIGHDPLADRPDSVATDVVTAALGSSQVSSLLTCGAVDLVRLLELAGIPVTDNAAEKFAALSAKLAAAPPPPSGGATMADSSFSDARGEGPDSASIPSLDELQDQIKDELSEKVAALISAMSALVRTFGFTGSTDVKKAVDDLRELLSECLIAGKLLGAISPWLPEINRIPNPDTKVKQQAVPKDLAVMDLELPRGIQGGALFPGHAETRFPWIGRAAQWLLDKEVQTQDSLRAMGTAATTDVFTAPALSAQGLNELRQRIVEGVRTGDSWDGIKGRIGGMAENDAKTTFRTYTKAAYMAGMDDTIGKPKIAAAFPYVVFVATHDTRTRHTHAELDGFCCAQDDPAYGVLQKALADWNCRCTKVPLSARQAASRTIKTYADLPADVRAKYGGGISGVISEFLKGISGAVTPPPELPQVKTIPPQKPPSGITFSGQADDFTHRVWAKIKTVNASGSVQLHTEAREVGRMIVEEARANASLSQALSLREKAKAEFEAAEAAYRAVQPSPGESADRQIVGQRVKTAVALAKADQQASKQHAEAVLDTLRRVRDIGTKPKLSLNLTGNAAMKRVIHAQAEKIPADWIKRVQETFVVDVANVKRGFFSMGHEIAQTGKHAGKRQAKLRLSGSTDERLEQVALHETIHAVERSFALAKNSSMSDLQSGFIESRRKPGEQLTKIYPDKPHLSREMGWKDEFVDHYMGKSYNSQNHDGSVRRDVSSWEIMSMGVEHVLWGKPGLLDDPGYMHFVIGVLASL